MKIENNRVVRFHYSLSDATGNELETSAGREPLTFLAGHNAIIPALEDALRDKEKGESLDVTLTPDQAYGERRDGWVQRVPKKHFKDSKLVPGQAVVVQTEQGQRLVTVQKVGMSVVDVDLNHPMAGKTLQFKIDIVDVREASEEEIAHKHVHGDGGHQH